MTENRRIVLNIIATYGRSVFAMALGLFSSRWVLASLGKEDYGLFGVVGSVMAFINLLGGVMGGAVGRYFAYSIGEAKKLPAAEGRENITAWFNAALTVYWTLPVVMIAIGYPVGMYALHHWLVIPPLRMEASEWIFRLSILSSFIGMATVPYISMYRAYQLIAELSIWGIVQTVMCFAVAYSLLHIDGDKLLYYATATMIVGNGILLIQAYRARRDFGVCHFRAKYFCAWSRIKKLVSFSFWEFFGCFSDSCRQHGSAFIINRYFGVTMNAAYSVSSTVTLHTTSLSNAMIGALSPAVTTAVGAGDKVRAASLAFRTCKFSVLLILIFAAPLIVEMDTVLNLWLVEPPEHAATFCRCVLFALLCHKLGWGHHIAIYAYGRIGAYQITMGIIVFLTVFLIWGLVAAGLGALGVGLSFVISYSVQTLFRVGFAKRLAEMPVRYWLFKVLLPVAVTIVMTFAAGCGVARCLDASFARICLTTISSGLITVAFGWMLVCNHEEKVVVREAATRMFRKFLRQK